jgi:hypothetical protein
VFITAGPSTKLLRWWGGGYWRTCDYFLFLQEQIKGIIIIYERRRAEACVD